MMDYLKEIWEYENFVKWKDKKRYNEYYDYHKTIALQKRKQKIDENKQALDDAIIKYKLEWKTPLEIFNALNKVVSFLKIKRIYNEV
jgi:hypothetical protein